jgi:hypothetical protein
VSLIPQSRTAVVETPHPFMPFTKIRVMSAPVSKFSLSSPIYTGQGKEIIVPERTNLQIGRYGALPLRNQFRYVALNVKGQRVGFALDRQGVFHGSAKRFDSIFST